MIHPFEYYLNEHTVRKSVPNIGMAKTLIQKAEIRLRRLTNSKIEDAEASIVFEELYECLREASQSLMELKGYKPYSHEALIAFLKEENLLPYEKIAIIDNYRILRNNSVYRGETVSLNKCFEAIEFAKNTLPLIIVKFNELSG